MIQRENLAPESSGTPGDTAGPVRMCIGCRGRELAVELLRVAAVSNVDGGCVVSIDPTGTLPGRGAWLHPRPQCLHSAIRRRAFARALRITGSPDTSAVVDYFDALLGTEVAQAPGNRTGSEEHEHTVKSR